RRSSTLSFGTGTSSATGRPRSVTSIDSPASTSLRNSLARCRSSRIPMRRMVLVVAHSCRVVALRLLCGGERLPVALPCPVGRLVAQRRVELPPHELALGRLQVFAQLEERERELP